MITFLNNDEADSTANSYVAIEATMLAFYHHKQLMGEVLTAGERARQARAAQRLSAFTQKARIKAARESNK